MRGIFALILCLLPVIAQALSCAVCGREIKGQYLRSGGRVLCSGECWEKLLPHCSLCDAPLAGRYLMFKSGGEKHLYCLKCSELPRCFSCDLPTDGRALPDGRVFCRACSKDAVTDQGEAETLYRQAEADAFRIIGSSGCGRTRFVLCGLETLNHGRKVEKGEKFELGRCQYEYRTRGLPGRPPKTVSEKCTVYILDSLPKAQFIEVAAHEAAHDWLNHHTKDVPPLWNEGFAEYIASLVNKQHGNSSRNLRMEENEDPVYGAGYRTVRDYAEKHGFAALLARLKGKW